MSRACGKDDTHVLNRVNVCNSVHLAKGQSRMKMRTETCAGQDFPNCSTDSFYSRRPEKSVIQGHMKMEISTC